jgi:4'-phosphopantetheinyl transferase
VARLAARWFGAEEAQALAALDPESARIAFLRLWTAKEASCKATGTGIFGYLGQWRFAVTPAQPQLSALPDAAGAPARWAFQRLSPSPDHTAVIALRDAPALQVSAYRLRL